jgi:hypothetical protein
MIVKPLDVEYFDKTARVAFEYAECLDIDYDEDHIIESIREHKISPASCWFNAMEGQQVVGFIGGTCATKILNKEPVGIVDFLFLLPEYNNEDNVRQLTFAFIDFCEKFKCDNFFIFAELNPETKEILENNLLLTNQNIIGRGM